jgi:hypothetical protein
MKIFTADSMKTNKLKKNLETMHGEVVGKTPGFIHQNIKSL